MKNNDGGMMMSEEKTKIPEREYSYQEVQELSREAWSGDYGIVGHDGDPLVSAFGEPRPYGEYSVTIKDLLEMGEDEFVAKLNEVEALAVVVQCMDKRGANLSYEAIREEVLQPKGLGEAAVFNVQIGGGVIQRSEVVQNGETVGTKREEAFKALMGYVARKAENVAVVVATDHDCRCGAEAYAADGQGWPERLGCEKGAEPEQAKMKELINEYAGKLLPVAWQENEKVMTKLVAFSGEDEEPAVRLLDTV